MLTFLTATTLTASAQALRTGYFSDSYLYRHHLNPALGNERSYFSFPALGNLSVNYGANCGISTFIKPYNGRLVTALHESVSTEDFLGGLKDKTKLYENVDVTLFSLGIVTENGYNTFEIGFHEQAGLQAPKALFSLLKEMNPQKTYSFDDLRVKARGWVDLSFGRSFQVGDHLSLGLKLKALLGAAYADLEMTDCHATFGENEWRMSMKGDFRYKFGKSEFKTDSQGRLDDIDNGSFGIAGYGGAVDLGVHYDMVEVVDGLKLSAAVTDLGMIRWCDAEYAYNDGKEFTWSGFNEFSIHDEESHVEGSHQGSLSDQWSDMRDDLEKFANLQVGKPKDVNEMLAATLTLGAEFELPAYKKLSFGMLYTQRFAESLGYQELRLNANWAPARIFDLAVSGAATTWGASLGALANLCLPGFNIFLGTDYVYTGKVNKDYIPLENGGMNVQFGINFPMGGK